MQPKRKSKTPTEITKIKVIPVPSESPPPMSLFIEAIVKEIEEKIIKRKEQLSDIK